MVAWVYASGRADIVTRSVGYCLLTRLVFCVTRCASLVLVAKVGSPDQVVCHASPTSIKHELIQSTDT